MNSTNRLEPVGQQIEDFVGVAEDGPIYMVNLLKFRERAAYADGRNTDLSGQDAYALYDAGVVETLADVGAKLVFFGEVTGLLVGEADELWDQVAIAHYPSRAAMMEMVATEKYQAIHVHREAGLEGQLNITTQGGVF